MEIDQEILVWFAEMIDFDFPICSYLSKNLSYVKLNLTAKILKQSEALFKSLANVTGLNYEDKLNQSKAS